MRATLKTGIVILFIGASFEIGFDAGKTIQFKHDVKLLQAQKDLIIAQIKQELSR
jgi:hypothetical protein